MSDFDFPRDALGISFVNHGYQGQQMNGYQCKKFFRKCKENMSAQEARLRFYFTIYGRLSSNSVLLVFSNEKEDQIRQDLIELVNDLKTNEPQTDITSESERDQEQVQLLWFALSRALGEGNRQIARTVVKYLTKQTLCILISEKLHLTNALSMDQTVAEQTNDINMNVS